MFCKNCGAEIPDNAVVCPKCGVATSSEPKVTPTVTELQRAPKSIGGFICGLLGFLLDWVPIVGFVLSIVGAALCGSGKNAVRSNPQAYGSTGLLTAGQVLGIIGIVASSIMLIITLIWGVILGGGGLFYFMDDILDILDL